MPTAGRIVINLSAGTGQFIVDMEKANAKLRDFGNTAKASGSTAKGLGGAAKEIQSGFSSAAEGAHAFNDKIHVSNSAMALLGEQTGVVIPRHLRGFISALPGVATALTAAFSGIAIIGIIGLIAEGIKRLIEFRETLQKISDAPARVREEFDKLNSATRLSNDELQVTNDKLAMEIAKLEGKPGDGLKLALDEARVAADKLATSLASDFEALVKLFKEENIGGFKGFLTGKASTTEFRDFLVGESGFGGQKEKAFDSKAALQDDLERISDAQKAGVYTEQEAVDQQAAARLKYRNEQEQIYTAIIARSNKELEERTALQAEHDSQLKSFGAYTTKDQSLNIGLAKQERENAKEHLRQIRETAENEDLQAKKGKLNKGEPVTDPLGNELKKLDAQIRGIQHELEAVGQSETAKTLAKGWAEAQKAIQEVNKELATHHKHLSDSQAAQITQKFTTLESAKAELEWKQKLTSTSISIIEQIRSQTQLTAAIGQGYELIKRANVETRLMKELGEKGNDPEWMKAHQPEVQRLRTNIGVEYDTKLTEQTSTTIDQLKKQIELDTSLASVEQQGASAVRLVTLAYQLREIAETSGLHKTQQLIEAEIALASAQHRSVDLPAIRKQIAAEPDGTPQQKTAKDLELSKLDAETAKEKTRAQASLAQIGQEIEATNRLTAAQVGGEVAVRQAKLENQIAQITRDTQPGQDRDAQIEQARQLSAAQHQQEITTQALSTGIAYQNQIDSIDEQIDALTREKAVQGDNLAIEIALKNLEQERAKIIADQVSVLGTARDGLKAFFHEMAVDGESAAKQVHDALKNAFDSLNDELSRIISGQKSSWQQFFQGISQQLAKQALQRLETTIAAKLLSQPSQPAQAGTGSTLGGVAGVLLGKQTLPGIDPNKPHSKLADVLGKVFGGGSAGKRDGNSPSTAFYVTLTGAQGAVQGVGGTPPFLPTSQVGADGFPPVDPNLTRIEQSPEFQIWAQHHVKDADRAPGSQEGVDRFWKSQRGGQPGASSGDVLSRLPSGLILRQPVSDSGVMPEFPELPLPDNSALAQLGNGDFSGGGGAGGRPGIADLPLPPPFVEQIGFANKPDGSSPSNPLFVAPASTAETGPGNVEQSAFASLASPATPALQQLAAIPGLSEGAQTALETAGTAVSLLGAAFGGQTNSTPASFSQPAPFTDQLGLPLPNNSAFTQLGDISFGEPSFGSDESGGGGFGSLFSSLAGMFGGGDSGGDSDSESGGGGAAGIGGALLGLIGPITDMATGDQSGGGSGKPGSSPGHPLFVKDVGGKAGSSSAGGLGGLLGGLFGGGGADAGSAAAADSFSLGDAASLGLIGGFAKGGDFPANKPMIVGEKGPELLIPKSAGSIIPNHKVSEFLTETDVRSERFDQSSTDRSPSPSLSAGSSLSVSNAAHHAQSTNIENSTADLQNAFTSNSYTPKKEVVSALPAGRDSSSLSVSNAHADSTSVENSTTDLHNAFNSIAAAGSPSGKDTSRFSATVSFPEALSFPSDRPAPKQETNHLAEFVRSNAFSDENKSSTARDSQTSSFFRELSERLEKSDATKDLQSHISNTSHTADRAQPHSAGALKGFKTFAGFFAKGGEAKPGPELFVSKSAGTILSNHPLHNALETNTVTASSVETLRSLRETASERFSNRERFSEYASDKNDRNRLHTLAAAVNGGGTQKAALAHNTPAGSPKEPHKNHSFAGFFAEGGTVKVGKAHMVGEKGPELFVPKSHGVIIPNDQLPSALQGSSKGLLDGASTKDSSKGLFGGFGGFGPGGGVTSSGSLGLGGGLFGQFFGGKGLMSNEPDDAKPGDKSSKGLFGGFGGFGPGGGLTSSGSLGLGGGLFGQFFGGKGLMSNMPDGGKTDTSDKGSSSGGGLLGGLFGGFRASGGTVSPSQAYMVGEQGPELMIGAANSTASHVAGSQTVNAPTSIAYYSIDARGTDPVLTEQRTRAALVAVHGSAVKTAFIAQSEHAMRTPQK